MPPFKEKEVYCFVSFLIISFYVLTHSRIKPVEKAAEQQGIAVLLISDELFR